MIKGFSRKAMSQQMIISVILAIVVLLILLPYVLNVLDESKVKSADMQCQQFFKSINGGQAYFGKKMDNVSRGFVELVSRVCPSHNVVVSSNNIKPAVELVENCFKKTGEGVDFLGANVVNENICLYCGQISSKDDIGDFKELFVKEIGEEKYEYLFSDDTGMENFNKALLDDGLPESIDESEVVNVFYWVSRADVKGVRNNIKIFFSRLFGESKWISRFSYYFSDNVVDTYFGVMLTDKIEIKENTAIDDIEHHRDINNCYVIVPVDNY